MRVIALAFFMLIGFVRSLWRDSEAAEDLSIGAAAAELEADDSIHRRWYRAGKVKGQEESCVPTAVVLEKPDKPNWPSVDCTSCL